MEHITEEILLRLPVKTLSQLKCVCKHWRDLIESRSFIDRHYRHESNQDRLVINLCEVDERGNLSSQFEEAYRRLQFPYLDGVIDFMGPANGLFCEVNLYGKIILLNPAMREIKAVPPLPSLSWHHPSGYILSMLAFGFGLDPFTGDCKIVAFHRDENDESKNFVCVYNSSSDSWEFIEAVDWVDSLINACWSKSKTFLNGVHYWVVPPFDDGAGFAILAFDMRSERFREIQVPRGFRLLKLVEFDCAQLQSHEFASLVKIVAYGDSIALMSDEFEWVDLWVMGKEGSWTKNFRVGPLRDRIIPICVWKNGVLFDTGNSDLILRDVSTQKVRIVKAPFKHKYRSMHSAFSYKDSLVSIKGERVLDLGVLDDEDHFDAPTRVYEWYLSYVS